MRTETDRIIIIRSDIEITNIAVYSWSPWDPSTFGHYRQVAALSMLFYTGLAQLGLAVMTIIDRWLLLFSNRVLRSINVKGKQFLSL